MSAPDGPSADKRKLNDLGRRLDDLERRAETTGTIPPKAKAEPNSALGSAFKLSTEFVAALVVGGGMGWLLDKAFGKDVPIDMMFVCRREEEGRLFASVVSLIFGDRVNVVRHAMPDGVHGTRQALDGDVRNSRLKRAAARREAWLPLAFAQELAQTHGLSHYMLALHHPADAPRLRALLSADARRAGIDLEVTDWKDTEGADLLRRGLSLLAVYRGLVVMVILIIAGASVLTTMMKTVRERTREIGTLRSLGYLRSHMLAMFAVESAILALYAGVVGLAAAAAVTATVNAAHIMYKAGLMAESIPLRIGYSPGAYLWGFVFLSIVAVSAALVAARKVASMRIAAALAD